MRARVIISNIRRLSLADKWLFFRAYLLATALRGSIRVLGFKKTMKMAAPFSKFRKTDKYQPVDIKKYNKLSALSYRAGKPLFNCLALCIAYWILLRRRGIISELKFGMILEENKLKAHSWLEYEGQPFTDENEINIKYTSFDKPIA